jgi:hypothetical protein
VLRALIDHSRATLPDLTQELVVREKHAGNNLPHTGISSVSDSYTALQCGKHKKRIGARARHD